MERLLVKVAFACDEPLKVKYEETNGLIFQAMRAIDEVAYVVLASRMARSKVLRADFESLKLLAAIDNVVLTEMSLRNFAETFEKKSNEFRSIAGNQIVSATFTCKKAQENCEILKENSQNQYNERVESDLSQLFTVIDVY